MKPTKNKLTDLRTLYFACTGNTCRSPLAQRILIEKLREKGIENISVQSRMSSACKLPELNIPLSEKDLSLGARRIIIDKYGDTAFADHHQAQPFTLEELGQADLVITMDVLHKGGLLFYDEAINKDGNSKIYTLGELVGRPNEIIDDPLLNGILSRSYSRRRFHFDGDEENVFYHKRNLDDAGLTQATHSLENHSLENDKHQVSSKAKTKPTDHYLKVFEQLESMIDQLLEKNEIIFRPARLCAYGGEYDED